MPRPYELNLDHVSPGIISKIQREIRAVGGGREDTACLAGHIIITENPTGDRGMRSGV